MIATPSRTDGQSTYMDVAEAARLLGRPPRTVRAYITSGQLRARRFGPRLWRVERASVEEHLAPSAPAPELTAFEQIVELLPRLNDAEQLRQVALRALSRAS